MPIPAPSTIKTLITDALMDAGIIGIDEVAEDPVLNRTLRAYNRMLSQWNTDRFMIYHLKTYSVVSTGAERYPVGVGQVTGLNTPGNPPDRIESAFLRQNAAAGPGSGPFDWPLSIIPATETYNLIRLKQLGTFARAIFYDTSFPIAYIKPWPIPQASIYEIHVTFKEQLLQNSNINDQITFPPFYEACIEYCLARRLRSNYQKPADPELNALARGAKAAVVRANVQIPRAVLPSEILSGGGGSYNYRSDTH